MESLYSEKRFTNCVIRLIIPDRVAEPQTLVFKCHKCILSQSPYLRKIYEEKNEVEISDSKLTPEAMRCLIEWMYGKSYEKSAYAKLTHSEYSRVLHYAKKWGLLGLFKEIVVLLGFSVDISETDREFAMNLKPQTCVRAVFEYIRTHLVIDIESGLPLSSTYLVFSSNGKKHYAHIEILYYVSEYFRRCFEENDKMTNLKNLNDHAVSLLLKHLYGVGFENLSREFELDCYLQLLTFAKENKMSEIMKFCVSVLNERIEPDSVIDVFLKYYVWYQKNDDFSSIVNVNLSLLFGKSKHTSEQIVEIFANAVGNDRNTDEIYGKQYRYFDHEISVLEKLKRNFDLQKTKIENVLSSNAEHVRTRKNKLMKTADDLESKSEVLIKRNQKTQQRLQKLGNIDPKRKQMQNKQQELNELKELTKSHGEDEERLERTLDLADDISNLRGEIFVYEEKHLRYCKEFQRTEEKLIGLFEMKENIKKKMLICEDSETQVTKNLKLYKSKLQMIHDEKNEQTKRH